MSHLQTELCPGTVVTQLPFQLPPADVQTPGHLPWASRLLQIGPAAMSSAAAADVVAASIATARIHGRHLVDRRISPLREGDILFIIVGAGLI